MELDPMKRRSLGRRHSASESSPYHVAATYPCGQPGSSSPRLTGGFCHADQTVPRQDVHSPFSPACATMKTRGCLHTRRFGTLTSPLQPVDRMPWGHHHPGRVLVLFHRLRLHGNARRSCKQFVSLVRIGRTFELAALRH